MTKTTFDAEYFRRFYENRSTAVIARAEARAEVKFVLAFCDHIGVDVSRFADVGAGTGWWAREFRRQRPRCRYVETYDASPYAARLYGHRNVPAERLGGYAADLVVCRDVLRYMGDRAAATAIRKLARKCRAVLYLHVLTGDDVVDEDASDMTGHLRSTQWYLRRLKAAGFVNAGMGLFVSRKAGFDPFTIELAGR